MVHCDRRTHIHTHTHFTVIGGQLAHLSKLRFFVSTQNRQNSNIDKQNHHQESIANCHHVWVVHEFATKLNDTAHSMLFSEKHIWALKGPNFVVITLNLKTANSAWQVFFFVCLTRPCANNLAFLEYPCFRSLQLLVWWPGGEIPVSILRVHTSNILQPHFMSGKRRCPFCGAECAPMHRVEAIRSASPSRQPKCARGGSAVQATNIKSASQLPVEYYFTDALFDK